MVLDYLVYIAVCFALLGTTASLWLINKHIHYFHSPHLQSKIVGIIWMVPIYSFNCVMSLLFPSCAVYIDTARDCYEAYVLYLFFALLVCFLSFGDDSCLYDYLETLPPTPYPAPFNLFTTQNMPTGKEYLKFVKFGTLQVWTTALQQYCVVKPVVAILALLLSMAGAYDEGSYSPLSGYFYATVATNISIALALSCLISFYYTFKEALAPLNPLPKFLCIKTIIFVIFWQGMLISLLVSLDVIASPPGWKYDDSALDATLQDFIICIEMALLGAINIIAFDYKPFLGGELGSMVTIKLNSHLENGHSDGHLRESLLPTPSGRSQRSSRGRSRPRKKQGTTGDRRKSHPNAVSAVDRGENSSANDDGSSASEVVISDKPRANISAMSVEQVNSGSKVEKMGRPLVGMQGHTGSTGIRGILDRHFAHSDAVRDFNEAMPVLVLPSGFSPRQGTLISSNPKDRVSERTSDTS